MRRGVATCLAAAVWAVAAPAAWGHVQITPAQVAPGDPVRFELLVPGETSARTIEVDVALPEGVLPFSFEDTPRWHRQLDRAKDGSVSVIRWHGNLRKDGFVRFSFLAATPEREGELVWKVIQRYDDGKDVAWIGDPGSDRPAPVTAVTASAARQNAGGEGGEDDAGAAPAASATPVAAARPADDDTDVLPLVLSAAGLLLGAIALALALRMRARAPRRREEARPSAEAW